jgi:hypothetical protein
MKHKKIFLLVLMTVTGLCYADDSFDGDALIDELLLDVGPTPLRSNGSIADAIVPPLNQCGFVDILKEDMFLRTAPLNTRDPLYEPSLQTPFDQQSNLIVKTHLFWNATNKCYFTEDCSDIDCHLGFTSPSLLEKVEHAFYLVRTTDAGSFFTTPSNGDLNISPEIFNADMRYISSLFAPIHVQERRAGLMFEINKTVNKMLIGVHFPVYWRERNFNITERDQQKIKAADLFPAGSEQAGEDFALAHLVSDKFGIGDTRLVFGYVPHKNEKNQVALGLFFTIPTAVAVQKGLIGSSFTKKVKHPPFSIAQTLNIGLNAYELRKHIEREMKELGTEFINRLSAMVAEESLGNGGHVGIGFFLAPHFEIDNAFSWDMYFTAEYLLPASEQRFFLKKVDIKEFNARNFDNDDETIAESNLIFLNDRMLDMFFPDSLIASVQPGLQGQLTNNLNYQYQKWMGTLGVDLWGQMREHISMAYESIYDFEKARKPWDAQVKLLARIARQKTTNTTDWILSLNGDTTVASHGIGKDYTISLNLAILY